MGISFPAGSIVKGKYVVERLLGEGGMGFVFAARHVALEQRVAIKFLRPEMLQRPEIAGRFAREALAASRLESDHVARVLDVDALEDGTPFIVMELLEGHGLSVVRRGKRPLPVAAAARYVLEACEALVEAHAAGIIHRDIKPANLFIARRRDGKTRVKVLDFGISKVSGPGNEPSLTTTSVVMGSAEYMSPEQMLSARDADARSDIWALGVTLYEIATARVPFPGDSITQVCALVMSSAPAPPSSHVPDLPAAFDEVVLRCLEKKPADRYASVPDLMAALAPFALARDGTRPVAPPTDELPTGRASYPEPAHGTTALIEANGARASNPSSAEPILGSSSGATSLLPAGVATVAPVSNGITQLPPPHSRVPFVLGAALLTCLAVGGAVLALGSSGSRVGPTPASALAASIDQPPLPPSALPEVPPPEPAITPTPESSATAALAATLQAEPESKKTFHKARGPEPGVSPQASAQPTQIETPKPNCTPPFTVDARGDHHAKPECL